MYMCRRYKSCCCHNKYNTDDIETSCCNTNTLSESINNTLCECGFDEEYDVFPIEPTLAQSYVPIQIIDKTFIPKVGLRMGTIFPELVDPYSPGQSMKEIEYLKNTNDIKEGCSK